MSNGVNQNILFQRPSLRSCETSPESPGPLKPRLPLLIFLHQKQVTQFSPSPICHTCRCYLSSFFLSARTRSSAAEGLAAGEGGGRGGNCSVGLITGGRARMFFLLQKSTARGGVPLIGRVALYIRNVLPCRREELPPPLTPPPARAGGRAPCQFARLRVRAPAPLASAVYTCARGNNIGASLTGFRDKKDRCAPGWEVMGRRRVRRSDERGGKNTQPGDK